jgi:hypothetical protein
MVGSVVKILLEEAQVVVVDLLKHHAFNIKTRGGARKVHLAPINMVGLKIIPIPTLLMICAKRLGKND